MTEATYEETTAPSGNNDVRCDKGDRLSSYVWGTLILWAGTSLVIDIAGVYRSFAVNGWTVFFLGAAAILVTEIVVRWASPSVHRPEAITYICAAVAVGIALGAFWVVFAAILATVGASILVKTAREGSGRRGSGAAR